MWNERRIRHPPRWHKCGFAFITICSASDISLSGGILHQLKLMNSHTMGTIARSCMIKYSCREISKACESETGVKKFGEKLASRLSLESQPTTNYCNIVVNELAANLFGPSHTKNYCALRILNRCMVKSVPDRKSVV